LLIDAFCAIRSEIPNARLVIAGTGDDEGDLRDYAAAKGVGGISFFGRVSEEMKTQLMQEAWVFAMPSSIEGWGIVVVEANACGTPAVAFDVSGLRDCIVHGKTGLLAQDVPEFTRYLMEVLSNESLRTDLSCEAFAWAREFSWNAAATRTLALIRQLQPWRAVFEPDISVPGAWTLQVPARHR
jgi:glycosyltransferase involved in cell wall biosynthesis